jgi:hypothetical protein
MLALRMTAKLVAPETLHRAAQARDNRPVRQEANADAMPMRGLDAQMWAKVAVNFEEYPGHDSAVGSLLKQYDLRVYVPRAASVNLEGGKLVGDRPSPAMVASATSELERSLRAYPRAFIRGIGFRRLVLVSGLKHKGIAVGAFAMGPAGAMFGDPASFRDAYGNHHELYHFADYCLNGFPAVDPRWDQLNAPGARYGSDAWQIAAKSRFTASLMDARRDLLGFVTTYALSAAAEDRAEVWATLVARRELAREMMVRDPVIAAKGKYLLAEVERIYPGTVVTMGLVETQAR